MPPEACECHDSCEMTETESETVTVFPYIGVQ